MIFEGAISCKAVLEERKRNALRLLVDKKKRKKDFSYIIALAKNAGVPVKLCSREEMNQICPHAHGGMLLEAESREFSASDTLPDGFLCFINGVEDPHNLGSICRTLYAAGCSALLLNRREWKEAEPVILKASAGAYERLQIFMFEKEEEIVRLLKENGIPLLCAERKDAVALTRFVYPQNFCLAIGGALRGLSAVLCENSSQNIYITYGRDFKNALDTASAAAVFAFEYVRQKEMEHEAE